MSLRYARLPEGTLPSGRAPRSRGIRHYPEHVAALETIDRQQDARHGELVTLGDDLDLEIVAALAEADLISLDADDRGYLRAGVTPGGDRALALLGR